jgi:hypothetical protein
MSHKYGKAHCSKKMRLKLKIALRQPTQKKMSHKYGKAHCSMKMRLWRSASPSLALAMG